MDYILEKQLNQRKIAKKCRLCRYKRIESNKLYVSTPKNEEKKYIPADAGHF